VRLLLLMFIALLSTGCELWYNSDKQKGDLRILIAASPKAELSEAYLSITKIKVQHQAGQWHEVPLSGNYDSTNWQTIQLSNPLTLAHSKQLPEGYYRAIKVYFEPAAGRAIRRDNGWNWPLYTSDEYTMEFANSIYVEGNQRNEALLWLDLQHSLGFYEDTYETYYRLQSPGLYAYHNSHSHVRGTITNSAWNQLNCPTPSLNDQNQLVGAYAYLYYQQQQNSNQLLDLQFNNPQAPFMSVPVYQNSSGGFYYQSPPLKHDNYIVAITCTGAQDTLYANNPTTVYLSSGHLFYLNKNSGFIINF